MGLATHAGATTDRGEGVRHLTIIAIGLLLAGLGTMVLVQLPWGQAATHFAARAWPTAEATVLSVSLDERPAAPGLFGSRWQLVLTARYTFEADGVFVEAGRVSLADTGDLDNRRLRRLYARLNFARVTGRTVPVLHDPDEPAMTLLDRRWPWKPAALRAGLGIALVILGGCLVVWRPTPARRRR